MAVSFGRKVGTADTWLGNWGSGVLGGDYNSNWNLPGPDATATFEPPDKFLEGWTLETWTSTLDAQSAAGKTCTFASQFETARLLEGDIAGSCVGLRMRFQNQVLLGWEPPAPPSKYRFIDLADADALTGLTLEVSELVGIVTAPRGPSSILLRRTAEGATRRTVVNHSWAYFDVWIGTWGNWISFDYNTRLPYPDATGQYDPNRSIDQRFFGGWTLQRWLDILNEKSAAGVTCTFAAQFQTARRIDYDYEAGILGACVGAKIRFEDHVVLGWSGGLPRQVYRFESIETTTLEVSQMVGVVCQPRGYPWMLLRRPA